MTSSQAAAPHFASGDVVKLKSGGPPMTVEKTETDRALCSWFANGCHERYFPMATLRRIRGDQR